MAWKIFNTKPMIDALNTWIRLNIHVEDEHGHHGDHGHQHGEHGHDHAHAGGHAHTHEHAHADHENHATHAHEGHEAAHDHLHTPHAPHQETHHPHVHANTHPNEIRVPVSFEPTGVVHSLKKTGDKVATFFESSKKSLIKNYQTHLYIYRYKHRK